MYGCATLERSATIGPLEECVCVVTATLYKVYRLPFVDVLSVVRFSYKVVLSILSLLKESCNCYNVLRLK